MSVPSSRPLPEPIRWHRHWVVLVRATFFPIAGILLMVFVPLLAGGVSGIPTRVVLVMGSMVLLYRASSLFSAAPQIAQTPLSQRESVLFRVTAPVRVLMAGVALGLSLAAILTTILSFILPQALSLMPFVYGLWLVFVTLWLVVNGVDWRNDLYILTHDRIIDQVRFPLLYDQRTEARLDQVQNVRYQQGFWGGILGFGDVTVETAGRTQAVLFLEVPNPVDIQRKIFARIDLLNERRAGEDATRRQDQLSKWFRAYHTLTGRIDLLRLDEEVQAGRPIHAEWMVNTGPDQHYETWIAHDTVSRAQDNAYADGTAPFNNWGRRRFHQIVPTASRGTVYLRVWLRLLAPPDSGQPDEESATRELTVRVV